MASYTGVVEKIVNRGKMWSIKTTDDWYGCGFEEPKVQEGQVVTFEWESNTKGDRTYKNVIKGTMKVDANTSSQGASTPQAVAYSATPSSRDVSIQYQSSRKDALTMLPILLENGAVPLPKDQADKYDAILASVSELTDKLYLDLQVVVENGGVSDDGIASESF